MPKTIEGLQGAGKVPNKAVSVKTSAALHVVDDARVAGGIAADGMNINARPRRRVAGHVNADYMASHAFSLWYRRVLSPT